MQPIQYLFRKFLVLLLLTSLGAEYACAGSKSNEVRVLDETRINHFAKSVEQFAADQGARVFILSRMGRPQNELPKGIDFTHTAIAVYSSIQLENGETVKGYAIHNLYQDKDRGDRSNLVVDYPSDFFWGVYELKAGVVIPSEELQNRILQFIAAGKESQLHNVHYSVIANPYNDRFQNCTEYVLDIINAAIYQTTDYAQLKKNTRTYFKAQEVEISPVKLFFGQLFMDDVNTQDQQGKIKTATATSIANYLRENDLLEKAVILSENEQERPLLSVAAN